MNSSGFILIDKPVGITSHDVIDRLRRITSIRKIGHAGTLDPFATGLLVVGIGREATKQLGKMMGKDKEYEAGAILGATSDTQDLTGQITPTEKMAMPKETTVQKTISEFLGEIEQVPPMFSAKKIRGKKLYELAREGKEVKREPVQITIHSLDITDYSPPKLSFTVRCSAGTYIRTLAHDIGQELGCGAYLEILRRTASGEMKVKDAIKLDDLNPDNWQKRLIR